MVKSKERRQSGEQRVESDFSYLLNGLAELLSESF